MKEAKNIKVKERKNSWREQPKRKIRTINLVETYDAISKNNFDKDFDNTVITNSSAVDQ